MYLCRPFGEGGASIKFSLAKTEAGAENSGFYAARSLGAGSGLQFQDCSLSGKVGTGGRKFG